MYLICVKKMSQCKHTYIHTYIHTYFSAVKRLIVINHIQNKTFCLQNICMCAVYIIMYVYIYKY